MAIIKAKYNGKCAACNLATLKDSEIDYVGGKAYHPACSPVEGDTVDPEALADRLGYRHFEWDQLRPSE